MKDWFYSVNPPKEGYETVYYPSQLSGDKTRFIKNLGNEVYEVGYYLDREVKEDYRGNEYSLKVDDYVNSYTACSSGWNHKAKELAMKDKVCNNQEWKSYNDRAVVVIDDVVNDVVSFREIRCENNNIAALFLDVDVKMGMERFKDNYYKINNGESI